MEKKTKTMMTIGILGACAGAGTYMYMMKNKKKMQESIKKYMNMTYPEIEG